MQCGKKAARSHQDRAQKAAVAGNRRGAGPSTTSIVGQPSHQSLAAARREIQQLRSQLSAQQGVALADAGGAVGDGPPSLATSGGPSAEDICKKLKGQVDATALTWGKDSDEYLAALRKFEAAQQSVAASKPPDKTERSLRAKVERLQNAAGKKSAAVSALEQELAKLNENIANAKQVHNESVAAQQAAEMELKEFLAERELAIDPTKLFPPWWVSLAEDERAKEKWVQSLASYRSSATEAAVLARQAKAVQPQPGPAQASAAPAETNANEEQDVNMADLDVDLDDDVLRKIQSVLGGSGGADEGSLEQLAEKKRLLSEILATTKAKKKQRRG